MTAAPSLEAQLKTTADGKTIAFTKRVTRGFCVFATDVEGKNVRQLTTRENEIGAVLLTWSPDGKKILYADQVGDALEIFVCDADGKNVKQLTNLGNISASAAWSPDMRWISFRVTDTAYCRSEEAKEKAYREKRADKRPGWRCCVQNEPTHWSGNGHSRAVAVLGPFSRDENSLGRTRL